MDLYEQKYKEALERAKDMLSYKEVRKEDMEYLFPELAESEDEKIRKNCIHFLELQKSHHASTVEIEECIAWLEKQTEHLENYDDEDILQRFSFYSYKDEPNIIYLSGLYVNAKHRNKGIGTKILTIADEVAARMGCNVIRLKTEIGGNAERLYRRNGYNTFKRDGNQVWLEKQELKSNPYSGVSFKYNGHIWGMRARDNGVEILFDGELKAFLSLEKSFIYPIYPKIDLAHIAHKSAREATKEEKVDNQNCIKHIENVESKFHEGDFIANDYCSGKVIEITNDAYLLDTGQGIPFSCEHNAHLWTIEDAKDGDVLVAHEVIVLFKEIDGLNIRTHFSYHYMNTPMVFTNELHNKMAFRPATKEQRELLFSKMKEAGYEWDAEKKVLKKIEPKTLDADKVIAWLNENVADFWESPCNPQNIINQFKEDFNL